MEEPSYRLLRPFRFPGILKAWWNEEITDHYDWLNPVADIYESLDSLEDIEEKVGLLLEDTDGDGTPDYYDQEPNTEKGAWTWDNGVTVDLDEDDVPDYRDDEPASEKGSIVDAKGVMVDKDKDRVPDYRDDDTNTPEGVFVRPNGTHDAGGVGGACCNCNDVTLPTIIFDRGSSKVKPEFYGVLYSVAEKMKECPDLEVKATGYAIRSKSQANLAVKRTNAIIEHLNQTYNIPRDRFEVNTEGDAPSGLEYSDRRIDLDHKK